MPKIYLSPAAHEHDRSCSFSSKCSENTHVNIYMDELIPYLDACGLEWKRSDKANVGANYDITIDESNAWKPDIHYAVHTNAYNGTVKGNRIGGYIQDTKSKERIQILSDWRQKIYPYASKVVNYSALGEVQRTSSICIYEELVFHDNAEDARWLHEHMREMAENAARAFCQMLDVTFVNPNPLSVNTVEQKVRYCVQVGAFSDRANAEKLSEELISKGYSTYIITKSS